LLRIDFCHDIAGKTPSRVKQHFGASPGRNIAGYAYRN
jgi:hypothetical protein